MEQCLIRLLELPDGRQHNREIRIGSNQIIPENSKPASWILSGVVTQPAVLLAPGAPAIILYRQVDRDDNGQTGHESNFVRVKILKEEGRKYADVEIPLALASRWMRTLTFNLDLFDFRTNIYPRFKILAALEFYKHIWIVGGVDDVFNGRGPGAGVSTGRDYFFGAQLTFNDDDIRALLTIGGAAILGSAGR